MTVAAVPSVGGRWLVRAAGAVLVRPALWVTAVAALFRLAPRGWWRRPPFLPLPDAAWLRFRLQANAGDDTRPPDPDDVVAYLRWCRRFGALR